VKLAEAATAQADAQKELHKAQEAAKAAAPSPAGANRGIIDMYELRKDPAYATIWRKQELRNINRQYGEELAKLNLPPEQAAKLKQLMIDREDASMDAREAAQNSGLSSRETNQAVTQAMGEVNDEIKALVGADTFNDLQNGQLSSGMKMMIQNQVGIDLTAAGVPLSNDQTSALAQIYAGLQNPAKNPDLMTMVRGAADPTTGLTPMNQAILDQAAQVLSPAQLPILKQSLIDQSEQQAYFRQRAENQRN
jgi:hypothetical protein